MKRFLLALTISWLCLLSIGCAAEPSEDGSSSRDRIPFSDDQLYAVAHLGYLEMTDSAFYTEQYLDGEEPPIHYFSSGDYYLIIPRYDGMKAELYQNDIESGAAVLVYEEANCRPFILQCNASDIFPDATIRLTYEEETAEFSPFLSLMDGSLDIGERGLLLTREKADGESQTTDSQHP